MDDVNDQLAEFGTFALRTVSELEKENRNLRRELDEAHLRIDALLEALREEIRRGDAAREEKP